MSKEFCLKYKIPFKTPKEIDIFSLMFCDVAFTSSKNTVGCIGYQDGVASVYGWGKHSDYVRVYSALKNNGFKILKQLGYFEYGPEL